MTFPIPVYTRGERLADGIIHALGVPASLAALIVLVTIAVESGHSTVSFSLIVYGAGLVATFGCSAAYNMVAWPPWKTALQRLDHCAIFLMIAGTYTPFAVLELGGAWGYSLLAAVWGIAAAGICLRLFAPQRLRRISIGLYLAQGWVVVVAADPLLQAMSGRVLALLAAGGVLYTVGVVFHVWERLPYQNAIWHVFVLAAAGCHYAAILDVAAA